MSTIRKTGGNSGEEGEIENVSTSTDAQVIQLHAPGRERTDPEARGRAATQAPPDAEAAEEAPETGHTAGFPEAPEVPEQSTPREAPVVAFPGAPGGTASQEPAGQAGAEGLSGAAGRALSFLRNRLTGTYPVDEFGFDPELTDALVLPPLRALYQKWFRVTTHGMQNVPSEGGALLVSNHSGTLPLDALMTAVAVHDEHPGHRHLRGLGADLIFQLPMIGSLARKSGQTLACNADAERLLRGGELVGVWPEGFKGIGKPFSSRYKLQRFGRGGFVAAALRTGVPIVPVSITGAEEIYPKIGDIKLLARLLGLPYFPVTPTFPLLGPLGAVPLPTKWDIEFGEPIRTDSYEPEAGDDPMLVFTLTDQVRESIQQTLYQRLSQRNGVFRG